jgi:hypothetical protein
VDIDNKLNNYLKITGIINNRFRPQNILKKTRIKIYDTLAFPACNTVFKIGTLKQDIQEE